VLEQSNILKKHIECQDSDIPYLALLLY